MGGALNSVFLKHIPDIFFSHGKTKKCVGMVQPSLGT